MSDDISQYTDAGVLRYLEAATEPDGWADHLIYYVLRGWENLGGNWHRVIATGESKSTETHATPPYTKSIDAAITTVPDGWTIETIRMWRGHPSSVSLAADRLEKGEWWHHGGDGRVNAEAPTTALAICLAAFKARALSKQKGSTP